MAGDWRRPAETGEALVAGGWLRTGDAARVDDDGDVWIVDRVDAGFVSGGWTVYPGDVERRLMTHAAVAGLAEMRRVTRRGGVVAACVWDFVGGRGPLAVFWDAALAIQPGAHDESGLPGTREGHLGELFRAAGIRDVTLATLAATIEHATFEAWWDPFTRGAGPAGAFVAGLQPGRREALRRECRRRLPTTPIVVTAAAWAARGTA